jgi:hypothetical protein
LSPPGVDVASGGVQAILMLRRRPAMRCVDASFVRLPTR